MSTLRRIRRVIIMGVLTGRHAATRPSPADGTPDMRICLLSREYPPETGWGGIGTYTYNLAHGLAQRGHRVEVIAQATGDEERRDDGPIAVHRIQNYRFATPVLNRLFPHSIPRIKYDLRVRQKLRELHRQRAFDVVEGPNFAAETLFARGLGPLTFVRLVTPLDTVLALQGTRLNLDLRLSCRLESWSVRRADSLLTSSPAMARELARFYHIASDAIAVCPLGIPDPLLPSDETPEDARSGVILFVGTLSERKGVTTLVDAAPRVLDELPSATIALVGRDSVDGDGRSFSASMQARVPERFRARVRFVGRLSDDELRAAYASASIVVAPSLYESFGQVYLEAMAYGKPLVASAIPPAMEIALDHETALLPAAGDAAALAAALIRLGRDGDMRRRMGRAGQRRFRASFTADDMAQRTEAIYAARLGQTP